jgi:uncharacterized protein (DUF4415 family)
MSEKRMVRHSADELPPSRTDWQRVDAMSEEEVEANATFDPDNPLWTEEDLAGAVLVMPEDRRKVPVSIRLDPEVVDFFKTQGRGYQSRINAVLRAYVRSQKQRGRRSA